MMKFAFSTSLMLILLLHTVAGIGTAENEDGSQKKGGWLGINIASLMEVVKSHPEILEKKSEEFELGNGTMWQNILESPQLMEMVKKVGEISLKPIAKNNEEGSTTAPAVPSNLQPEPKTGNQEETKILKKSESEKKIDPNENRVETILKRTKETTETKKRTKLVPVGILFKYRNHVALKYNIVPY